MLNERICPICGQPVKKKTHRGTNKGYLRTCGELSCRKSIMSNNSGTFKKGHKLGAGRIPSEETRKRMSEAAINRGPSFLGKNHSLESRQKMSASRLGKVPPNKGKSPSLSTRKKMSEAKLGIRGEDHPLWRGGYGKERTRLMGHMEYKKWREAVLERDNYRCQSCWSSENLHAHHIKEWSKFEELRYTVSNGLTLCAACHINIHKEIKIG